MQELLTCFHPYPSQSLARGLGVQEPFSSSSFLVLAEQLLLKQGLILVHKMDLI